MKKALIYTLMIVMSVFAIVANPAVGHSAAPEFRARIPFDFRIGSEVYPAGEYTIGMVAPQANHSPLIFRNLRTGKSRILNLTPGTPAPGAERPTMSFMNFEGQIRLTSVKTGIFAGNVDSKAPGKMYGRQSGDHIATVVINLQP